MRLRGECDLSFLQPENEATVGELVRDGFPFAARQRDTTLEITVGNLELVDPGARARIQRQRAFAAHREGARLGDDLHAVGGNTWHGDHDDHVLPILEYIDGRLPRLRLRGAGEPEEPAVHAI